MNARTLRLAVAAGVTVGLTALSGVAAADPDNNHPGTYDLTKTDATLIAGVGADADAELMNHIAAQYNAAHTAASDNELESYDAINPQTGVASEAIQTKPGCSLARPNGANAGVTALLNNQQPTSDATDYCIDYARSSRAKKGTETGLTFWELAPDAVTWATVGTSYAPPTPLTATQLAKIFTCVYDDWSQVGGQPGAIHLYLPPATAGTYTFFLSAIGLTGGVNDVQTGCGTSATNSNVFDTQQNDGTKLDADPQGIAPYAVSKWAGQKNATDAQVTGITDLRGGAVLGHFNDTTPPTTTDSSLGSTYTVLNSAFTNTGAGRFLYNVTRGGNTPANIPAWADGLFGINGYICTNENQLLIPFGTTPLGTDTGQSNWCGKQS